MTRSVVALLALACASPPATDPLPLGSASEDCASCHEEHGDEHALSPHAASARSPLLAAMLPEVERAWGSAARDQCVGCHAPEHSPDEGIGCVSCHAAVGNHASRDGMLAIDTRVPLSGPFADAERTIAHGSRNDGFLSSPQLCGTCHELTGPVLVSEPTLTEFEASPQARAGMTCIDCHMPRTSERAIANTNDRVRPTRDHRFIGFDPPWGASREEAARAAEETRRLLASALDLRIERTATGVDVVLTNVGAGHSVPTGAAFLRDIWVDVEIDGAIRSRVIELGDQPMHEGVPVPLLTRADRVELGSLVAGAERRVHLDADPGAVITAHLYARAVRDDVLAALGLEARSDEVPTHRVLTAAQ
jgi:hypothetical protein